MSNLFQDDEQLRKLSEDITLIQGLPTYKKKFLYESSSEMIRSHSKYFYIGLSLKERKTDTSFLINYTT